MKSVNISDTSLEEENNSTSSIDKWVLVIGVAV
jgi:hypothetical protein